jgi:hypothetical protein
VLQIAGRAEPGSRLVVSASPEWREVRFDLAASFVVRIPITQVMAAAPYVKVALQPAGDIQISHIRLTGPEDRRDGDRSGPDTLTVGGGGAP